MTENEAIQQVQAIMGAAKKAHASGEPIPTFEEARKAEAMGRLDRYHEANARLGLNARQSFERSKIEMRADMEIVHGADHFLTPSEQALKLNARVDATAEIARAQAERELDTFISKRMEAGETYRSAIRMAMREIRSTVDLALGAKV